METPDRLKNAQGTPIFAKNVASKFKPPKEKLPEVSIFTDDFDHAIGRLNKILYREHNLDDLKQKEGKRSLHLLNILEKESDPKIIASEIQNYFRKKANCNSVKKIFSIHSLEPQFGDKNFDKKFGNLNIVIGLNGRTFQYRVDYDEKKGLHVNFITMRGVQIAICINNPKSKRFGLSSTSHHADNYSEHLEEIIKYKFWIKMTLGYYLSANKLKEYQSAFQYFFNNCQLSFDALQGIASIYAGKECKRDINSELNKCTNEIEIATLFFNNEAVRDALMDTIIDNLSKHSIMNTHAIKEDDSEDVDYSKTAENSSESDTRTRSRHKR